MFDSQYMQRMDASVKAENALERRRWCKEIPFIEFRPGWKVQVIPPFGGAIVRFVVRDESEKAWVSVYFDAYGALGAMDEPYWELYPYQEDVYRVLMDETDELMQRIQESIDEQLGRPVSE